MKVSGIIISIAGAIALGTEGTLAGCYSKKNPLDKPDKSIMNSWALHACHRKNGMFTGWFAPGQTKAMCPQLSGVGHRKVLFEVQNLNKNTGFDLGDGDCYTRLANEIEGCSDGGSSNVAGWRFRVDPDAC